mmetsp:Transcript_106048/g.210761  ORF Transcript_106048/g.210761 Transcript_106048/m.210761 type:complete len:640 (+) Transcript_106048:82-2001(+)
MPCLASGSDTWPYADATGARASLAPMESGEDPEQVMAMLMRKFSGLIDKVQVVEASQTRVHEATISLEARVRDAQERHRAATAALQAQLQRHQVDADMARKQVAGARSHTTSMGTELCQARRGIASLAQHCETLESRRQAEHRSFLDAADAVAQNDQAWAVCEVEKGRLKGEIGELNMQLGHVEEELVTISALEQHRKEDVRLLQERIAESGRAWQTAECRAEAQQKEVCDAVKNVTLYRQRLEAAEHALHRREEELCKEDQEIVAMEAQIHRREQEVSAIVNSLGRRPEVKQTLEQATRVSTEVYDRLRTCQHGTSSNLEKAAVLSGKRQDLLARFARAEDALESHESDVGRWKARLQVVQESLEQCEDRCRLLEESRKSAGCTSESLQGSLQCALTETEQLRAECDETVATTEELHRRLRFADPALETAKRRSQELEALLSDATSEVQRALLRKEAFRREVATGREKMRSLKRRYQQLVEKAQGLEKKLLRSSCGFGGTAGFAAAAAAVKATACNVPTEPNNWPTVDAEWPEAWQEDRLCDPTCANDRDSLGYLRQWIESEEARIGVARTPPRPCAAPLSPPRPYCGPPEPSAVPLSPLHSATPAAATAAAPPPALALGSGGDQATVPPGEDMALTT